MKTYTNIVQSGKQYTPHQQETKAYKRLNPGCYTLHNNRMTGEFWFEEFKNNHDSIIDLPSPEFQLLTKQMVHFLKPEVKSKFLDKGFLYKRSALLYGNPGTGKTVLVNRVVQEVIKNEGIVIFATNPDLLPKAYDIIDDLQPNTTTLVILEEFDTLIRAHGESIFLNLLDGEIQKQNIMYLATTNYLEKIPKRIIRPGRMSSVIEVKYPNSACRHLYFSIKMGKNFKDLDEWVEKTNGVSVDELKEVVQSVYIFEENLDDVIKRIKATRDFTPVDEIDYYEDEEDDSEDEQQLYPIVGNIGNR